MAYRTSPGRTISPGRVLFASTLPTSPPHFRHEDERLRASTSPGRTVFADKLPVGSRYSRHEEEPRLFHRMGARRMRRFLNDNFLDSPVAMDEAVDNDACTLSTQLPFFQSGCRFSSQAAWLADLNDDNVTPPRRRPPPAARRPTTKSSSSGNATTTSTAWRPVAAPLQSSPEESRARSMLHRLSAADRALLRTHVAAVRSRRPATEAVPAAPAAPPSGALVQAEFAVRRYLIVVAEQGEWEHIEQDDDWLLVASDPEGDLAASPVRAAAAGHPIGQAGVEPQTSRTLLAAPAAVARRKSRRRRTTRASDAATATGAAMRIAAAPRCALGLAPSAHSVALLRAVCHFYGLRVVTTPPPSALAAAPDARCVAATLPPGPCAHGAELRAAAGVSLAHALGLPAPALGAADAADAAGCASAPTADVASASRRRLQMAEAAAPPVDLA